MKRETAIELLRQHETELRQLGVVGASLVGSVAREQAGEASDVDVVVRLAPELRGFYAFGALDRVKERLGHVFRAEVDVIPEPLSEPLKSSFEGDRCIVF